MAKAEKKTTSGLRSKKTGRKTPVVTKEASTGFLNRGLAKDFGRHGSGKTRSGSKTDWDSLRRLTDAEVERRAKDDPDAQPTDEDFWADAKLVLPKTKTPVSIRIDDDVLFWFRSFGRGYQTKMNAVLRAYMENMQKSRK